MTRNQLPPQIRKIELSGRKDGRPVVRYEIKVDVPKLAGRRKQIRRRKLADGSPISTEAQARAELARILNSLSTGQFVHDRKTTVDAACTEWLASKRSIKPSTKRGYGIWLAPLREELGDVGLQKLTKAQVDDLINRLNDGEVPGHKEWTPRSINGLLGILCALLDDQVKQGHIIRNVAKLVDRMPSEKSEMKTLTEDQMFKILDYPDRDRHVWTLALYGLRRGELAGLRWSHVDFDNKTISVFENRVTAGKEDFTGTPKSQRSRRVLPMPVEVFDVLRDARDRIESEFVVCNEAGEPLRGGAITHRWMRMLQARGIRHVRLHDARHSCASLMHLRGVPIAVIAAWMGHASSAFTLSTYVHAQNDALKEASMSFGRTNE